MPTTPHLFRLAVALVALTACNGPTVPDDSGSTDDSAEPDDTAQPGLPTCDDGSIEVCDDGIDNDGDGLVDGLDRVDCREGIDSPNGVDLPSPNCSSGTDGDRDGLVGCDDPSCVGRCEVCDDGIDNDNDGLVDCDDWVQCWQWPCAEECFNGVDDNADGRVDLADPRCWWWARQSWSASIGETVCDDGIDNDSDGYTDAADPDCAPDEICDDGVDNDIDTFVDHHDPDCWRLVLPEDCADGLDNDHDGLADCDDRDCDGGCAEDCDDGADNDGNGLIDCEDAACVAASGCFEDCTDSVDNDGDGTTDCWDDDCWGPECVGATRTTVSGFGIRAQEVTRLGTAAGGSSSNWVRTFEDRDAFTASSVTGNVQVADGYGGVLTSCALNVGEIRAVNSEFRRSRWRGWKRYPLAATHVASVGKQIARPVEVFSASADCADAEAALPDRLVLDDQGVWTGRPKTRRWLQASDRVTVWPEEQYLDVDRRFLPVDAMPRTCSEAESVSWGSSGFLDYVDATSVRWSASIGSEVGEPFYAPAP